jgi:hypothetical protein
MSYGRCGAAIHRFYLATVISSTQAVTSASSIAEDEWSVALGLMV